MRRLPALFMTVRSEIAEKPGEEHQARGTTFLLITPSLWPRASRVNIGDYSRSAREYCGLGEGTTIFQRLSLTSFMCSLMTSEDSSSCTKKNEAPRSKLRGSRRRRIIRRL